MTSPNGFLQKTINLESRTFSLQLQKFENGYFISVTEGPNKIGSMVVSLSTGPTPITTTIIPSRTESLFLKLIAERISSSAKALMSEIMEMVENE